MKNAVTDNDAFYHNKRKEVADAFDHFIKAMRSDERQEAQLRTHIGIYDINLLTTTVHLIDRPDEETIKNMPKIHREQYELFCKIAKEVWIEKGFTFLEY